MENRKRLPKPFQISSFEVAEVATIPIYLNYSLYTDEMMRGV